MKQILTFSAVLFTLLFLLFSDTDRRIQIFTELAGPGMLSLLKLEESEITAAMKKILNGLTDLGIELRS